MDYSQLTIPHSLILGDPVVVAAPNAMKVNRQQHLCNASISRDRIQPNNSSQNIGTAIDNGAPVRKVVYKTSSWRISR